MARKARPWWVCRCGHRNERLLRKCVSCGKAKPKKRVPAHARTLRDDSYERYCGVAEAIHGVTDERCCVCGKPRGERRHDRDHGHLQSDLSYGKPRGLACVVCNRLMPRELDADKARLIAAYLERVDNYYRNTKPEGQ